MKKVLNQRMVSLFLILATAGLIIAGLLLGQHSLVLGKAIRVCLECIGIG